MKSRWTGIFFVVTSAILWGVSGTVSQYLFSHSTIPVKSVVAIRMLVAGTVLLLISIYKGNSEKVFKIWKEKKSALNLAIYAIFGMLGVQFTYFTTISLSNAAVATLLQFLAPILVIAFYAIKLKQKIKIIEITALFLALFGTFLLLTNGSTKEFAVSKTALVWGVVSAFALAFYTIYVKRLLKWPSSIVIGWSMVIGGSILGLFSFSFDFTEFQRMDIFLSMLFIIIFGTVFPFYFFIESLRYINPKEASLLSCAEPLSALITSILWLHTEFGSYQFLGALIIMGMILMLTVGSGKEKT